MPFIQPPLHAYDCGDLLIDPDRSGDIMEKFLRSWRQDALNRGQHDAAIYIGDKVLALTSESLSP